MLRLHLPVLRWRGAWSVLYPGLFTLDGVPGGILVIYALMTHFEPRQARPAVPVLLLFVLAADAVLRAVTTHLRPESLSPAQPD